MKPPIASANTLSSLSKKWSTCCACRLHTFRFKPVIYRGYFPDGLPVHVVFIGEAPGTSENLLGRPFVGPAGQLFNEILDRVQDEIASEFNTLFSWIVCNAVCCFPEVTESSLAAGWDKPGKPLGQRTPYRDEIIACRPHLTELLNIARPKLVITVGRVAKTALTGTKDTCDSIYTTYPVQAIMHPAALLRSDNEAFQDLEFARAISRLTNWIKQYVFNQDTT